MKIGEEKKFGIYKAEKQGEKYIRKIYTDHNTIMSNTDFISKMGTTGKKKIITSKGISTTSKSKNKNQ